MELGPQTVLPVWTPVVLTAAVTLALTGAPTAVKAAPTTCLPRRVDAKPVGRRHGTTADGRDG